ncbi:helix-turn-helix transcriptional regulator [Litoribacillus peritrichatus]|uniref:Helix-turn-helix transcriptional regulator n=1 Tax=Litoribacillus peritrichatus TaxID=718191 RepID=A0ABP7N0G8_9GAMM
MTINIEKRTLHGKQVKVRNRIPKHWLTLNGETINAPDDLPRRFVIHSDQHQTGMYAPFHSHDRGQLLFITKGLIQVSAKDNGHWIVPPQRAVWIPPFIEHDALTINPVQLHNVYLSADICKALPTNCQVVTITPLLRELIIKMATFKTYYDESGPEGRLVDVFLDELQTTPEVPLYLPQPNDQKLLLITEALQLCPADKRTMEDWGSALGLSPRTLARKFKQETNLTFGQWRQQARLLAAITRIAQNDSITNIAQDLGYDSQSAFISMFKRALGKTPGQYFERN